MHPHPFTAKFDQRPPPVGGASQRREPSPSDVSSGVVIMKSSPVPTSRADASDFQGAPTGRRRLVVGAGVAAGVALAATALQRKAENKLPAAAADTRTTLDQGYRLTDHVRRYYETTRT
jgi:hypothetical protein